MEYREAISPKKNKLDTYKKSYKEIDKIILFYRIIYGIQIIIILFYYTYTLCVTNLSKNIDNNY